MNKFEVVDQVVQKIVLTSSVAAVRQTFPSTPATVYSETDWNTDGTVENK